MPVPLAQGLWPMAGCPREPHCGWRRSGCLALPCQYSSGNSARKLADALLACTQLLELPSHVGSALTGRGVGLSDD